jgi:transcriptional regulator with XRE-family HTH domain
MSNYNAMTAEELQEELGGRLRRLRVNKDLDQATVASKAGISVRSLRSLENGTGSNLRTLMLVLKTLDSLDGIDALAPVPTISPMAMLKRVPQRQRVRRSRTRGPLP